MQFKLNLIHFLLLLGLLISSCHSKNQKIQESVKLKAYRLIDAGMVDDAIVYLEKQLNQDPQNREFKEILASAYADKAGVKIQTLMPFIKQISQLSEIEKNKAQIQVQLKAHSAKGPPLDKDEFQQNLLLFSFFLSQSSTNLQLWVSIPTVHESDFVYLKHGIGLLEDLLTTEKKQNIGLYKAILDAVSLKFYFTQAINDDSQIQNSTNCQFNSEKSLLFIDHFSETLVHLYLDLAISHPISKIQNENNALFIQENTEKLKTFLLTAQSQKNTDLDNFKNVALENKYGNLVLCN